MLLPAEPAGRRGDEAEASETCRAARRRCRPLRRLPARRQRRRTAAGEVVRNRGGGRCSGLYRKPAEGPASPRTAATGQASGAGGPDPVSRASMRSATRWAGSRSCATVQLAA